MPEFLPAMPVDPRDGQPLRLKHFPEGILLYAPQDSAAVENGNWRGPESRWPVPVFRLYAQISAAAR